MAAVAATEVDLGAVSFSGRIQSAVCPVCGDSAGSGEIVFCETCLTVHHADCFRYNKGCAVYACYGSSSTRRLPSAQELHEKELRRARRSTRKSIARPAWWLNLPIAASAPDTVPSPGQQRPARRNRHRRRYHPLEKGLSSFSEQDGKAISAPKSWKQVFRSMALCLIVAIVPFSLLFLAISHSSLFKRLSNDPVVALIIIRIFGSVFVDD